MTGFDPLYFPGGVDILNLVFNPISLGLPFNGVEPTELMWDGTNPVIGSINGVSGPDTLFQGQANNSFEATAAVPEPGTIAGALMGIGFASLGAIRTYRRRSKQSA